MKKIIFSALSFICSIHVLAQTNDLAIPENLDFEEDTTSVTSLNDIIKTQEQIYAKSYQSNFIKSVWKRQKAFTVSYENTTLTGQKLNMYDNGEYKERDVEFKSDWGVSLKRSRTSAFHKHAIANILSFGLEHSFFDISVNHYKRMEGEKLYNSNILWEQRDDDNKTTKNYNYATWGTEMYSFAYGIKLGPSITIAPFARCHNRGLAHIRLQSYFNIGYRASLLWLMRDEKADANYDNRNNNKDNAKEHYEKISNSTKINWGHGMTTSWGIRLNWKTIGIGYEVINGDLNFKSIEGNIYGPQKTKFSQATKRLSISVIW